MRTDTSTPTKIGQVRVIVAREQNVAGTTVLRLTSPDGVTHELCDDQERYQYLDINGYRAGGTYPTLWDAAIAGFGQWVMS